MKTSNVDVWSGTVKEKKKVCGNFSFQESWVSCGSVSWKPGQQQTSEDILHVCPLKEIWLVGISVHKQQRTRPYNCIKTLLWDWKKISNANGWMPVNAKSVGN